MFNRIFRRAKRQRPLYRDFELTTRFARPPEDLASKPVMRKAFLEVVDRQLQEGDPPETRLTLERLMGMGYSDKAARKLIASAVAAAVWRSVSATRGFDRPGYLRDLQALPKLPGE